MKAKKNLSETFVPYAFKHSAHVDTAVDLTYRLYTNGDILEQDFERAMAISQHIQNYANTPAPQTIAAAMLMYFTPHILDGPVADLLEKETLQLLEIVDNTLNGTGEGISLSREMYKSITQISLGVVLYEVEYEQLILTESRAGNADNIQRYLETQSVRDANADKVLARGGEVKFETKIHAERRVRDKLAYGRQFSAGMLFGAPRCGTKTFQ